MGGGSLSVQYSKNHLFYIITDMLAHPHNIGYSRVVDT